MSAPSDTTPTGHVSRPPRTKHLAWLAVAVVVVGLAAVGYRAASSDGVAAPAAAETTPGRSTVEVVRETISDTRSFAGTLGHGAPTPVRSAAGGVVTALAEHGTEVIPGTELFRIDERPVVALYGTVPAYRDMRLGDQGRDVSQLLANLTALGHADCPAEDEFTRCVEDAVRAWQHELDLPATGVVTRADVVFVPESTRVGSIHAPVGDVVSPGSVVVDLASTDQIVGLDVDVRHRDLLPLGAEVTLRLPGGAEATGIVTTSLVAPAAQGGGSNDAVARVEVTLDEKVDVAYVGAPVDVAVAVGERADVLTIPVTALLALSGGGHAVEVVNDAGTTELVPVETGLFAGGRVEVTGDGIAEGTTVVVAGR
jgi:multidrug efflux pump subunit AcrA (membrane-fusion protein)